MTTKTKPLLTTQRSWHGPSSWYEVLHRHLLEAGLPTVRHQESPITRTAGSVASKLKLQRNLRRGDQAFLTAFGWAGDGRLFPTGIWTQPVVIAFDCWDAHWPAWEGLMKRNRVRHAFISARSSAEHLDAAVDGLRAHWLPEAIDPDGFTGGPPLADRSIDIVEMGRRFEPFHDEITAPLRASGIRHEFGSNGKRLFEGSGQLVAGIEQTKLFVAYPRSLTDPATAGQTETMTLRYLEGMLGGALIVGSAPQELVDLFGYDPVVPLQPGEDPADKIVDILSNLADYQALVDRNRASVLRTSTWAVRVQQLFDLLRDDYEVPPRR